MSKELMKKQNIRLHTFVLLAASVPMLAATASHAQIASKGLPVAANTLGSFVDASIARDSGLNEQLDLLNDFYPAIEVHITDHDNVRRRSDFQEQDLKIVVLPSLAYKTNIGRHKFYVAYNGEYTYHDDLDQEDSQANSLTSKLGLDISSGWDINLFGSLGDAYEERGISGSRSYGTLVPGADLEKDKIDFISYGADLIYGRKSSPLVAVLGIERHESEYTNNFQGDLNPTGNRDRDSESIHFDLSYEIGDRTSIFGRLNRTETDYERTANSLDSEQTDFIVGLRWKPSRALSGVVGIGTSDKNFDDARRNDYDDYNYYANLNYSINPFSTLQFGASKFVEEPGDEVSDFYESSLFAVSWDHAIRPRLLFNAFAKWVEDDYDSGRNDDFFDFGLGLDYVFKPWLTAGAYFGQIDRESNINSLDYDDTYFGIRLRSDLRRLISGRGDRELDIENYKSQR